MSLTDLKKGKDSKATKEQFTVDDFIADADNYAKGAPQIVSNEGHAKINLKQAIHDAKRLLEQKKAFGGQTKPLSSYSTYLKIRIWPNLILFVF